MTYNTAKQELINSILKNPAKFLIAQFQKGGVFETAANSVYDLPEAPVIMHVKDDGDIRLAVTVWDTGIDSFYSTEYQAYTGLTESGNGLEWHDDTTRSHKRNVRATGDDVDLIAAGNAIWEWEDIAYWANARDINAEYVWVFPLGTRGVGDNPHALMYANNRPNL